jgi:hypothetical protein
MKITFSLTEINQGLLPKYSYAAVNGDLTIAVDDIIIFNEPYVLLLELAFSFEKWLNNTDQDFIYDSIDHDEPIFSFVKTSSGLYSFNSIWAVQPLKRLLTLDEIKAALATYSTSLPITIYQKYSLMLTGNFLLSKKH